MSLFDKKFISLLQICRQNKISRISQSLKFDRKKNNFNFVKDLDLERKRKQNSQKVTWTMDQNPSPKKRTIGWYICSTKCCAYVFSVRQNLKFMSSLCPKCGSVGRVLYWVCFFTGFSFSCQTSTIQIHLIWCWLKVLKCSPNPGLVLLFFFDLSILWKYHVISFHSYSRQSRMIPTLMKNHFIEKSITIAERSWKCHSAPHRTAPYIVKVAILFAFLLLK